MTIPIVQGRAVDPPEERQNNYYQASNQQPLYNQAGVSAPYEEYGNNSGNFMEDSKIYTHEELQQARQSPKNKYQDVCWAVIFWIHLAGIVGYCIMMLTSGNAGGGDNGGNAGNLDVNSMIFIFGVCALVALGLSVASLQLMQAFPDELVKYALVFSCILNLAVALLTLMAGSMIVAIFAFIGFAISCCYAYAVWHRIPFAAANLKTALTGVKANMGLAVVAFIFMALGFGWSILWFMGLGNSLDESALPLVFVLFLSYYWVHNVLKNTVHVTCAGVIGTWWFDPVEAQFWSPALSDSLWRAVTTSFGSICFGSFLVAFVQALRALEHYTRDNEDLAIVRCIVQCILSCIESIIEFMNRWAYVYCGLYGMDYITAGRNVITLFKHKGWTVIISDDLASNVLMLITFGVGIATGLIGLMIGYADADLFAGLGFENGSGPGFLVGFLVGFLFASIYLGVVDSAITTVIVCYAEAPAEFQMNHPELHAEMVEAWAKAWPELSN